MRAVMTLRRIAGTCAVLALAACASAEPAPQDTYYRVDTGVPGAQAARVVLPGVVVVERFAVEGLTSGRAINYVDAASPNRLQQYFYHHWAEPPNVMLRDALVAYLRGSGAVETVITPAVRTDANYAVTGAINTLERRMGPAISALVELEIAVTEFDSGDLVHVGTYRAEVPADGAAIDDTVVAFNRALADIFARFVADVTRK